jgi:hypothetical protein
VLADSYDRLGGETGSDPIDAYLLLMREKVAFALALLEQPARTRTRPCVRARSARKSAKRQGTGLGTRLGSNY